MNTSGLERQNHMVIPINGEIFEKPNVQHQIQHQKIRMMTSTL